MAFLAGVVVSAIVAVVLTHHSKPGVIRLSTAAAPSESDPTTVSSSSTTTTPSVAAPTTGATVPLATTVAPTLPSATTTIPPTTTAPSTNPTAGGSTPGGVLTGTVDDSSGRPVAGAYVIGLDSLTVARTDASGQFTMSCQLIANGISGNRAEPLVASSWLLPVQPTGQGSYGYGHNTTLYGAPPTGAGLGYAFSGGSIDAASASIVSCGGPAPHFVLDQGGGVDIEFLASSGAPLTESANGVPVDNLYLPGLGDHAALETAPLSDGHQVVQQLGAGTLQVDGTETTLSCQGAGVVPTTSSGVVDVTITPGTTTKVVCTTGS
jgi:hypothetical protein